MRKILITGGKGMLATDLVEYFSKDTSNMIVAPSHEDLDVLDREKIRNTLIKLQPDIVIHTAAYHVNDCEDNPEMAYRLNGWATGQLAAMTRDIDAIFVYISTCGFFGDEIRPYSEYDKVVLKTEYAKSKYAGEVLTQREGGKFFIVRPGWLFGGQPGHKKNFVYQRYLEALKTNVMQSAGDKYGSPTYTVDLALKLDELLKTDAYGVYHMANDGGTTRAGYIEKITKTFGLDIKVESVDSGHFPRKANVPDCEVLNNWNLKYLGLSPMPSWGDAIERFVAKLQKMN